MLGLNVLKTAVGCFRIVVLWYSQKLLECKNAFLLPHL
jgi:hypothetical protein